MSFSDAFMKYWNDLLKQQQQRRVEIENVAPPKPMPPRARVWSQSKVTGIEAAGSWWNEDQALRIKATAQKNCPDFDYWLEYETEVQE